MQRLNVVWFRNDLRCYDNACLSSAVEYANRTGTAVIGLFIATPDTWQLHDMAPIKQDLLRRRVIQLQVELQQINIPLISIEGSTYDAAAGVFSQLAKQFQLHVFLQNEYELREIKRDQAVEQVVQMHGGQMQYFDTQCIMPPGSVSTQQGDVYKVFTPFKRNWLKRLNEFGVQCHAKPKQLNMPNIQLAEFTPMQAGDGSSTSWSVVEAEVLGQMRDFCRDKVHAYKSQRDFPAIDGTSKISAYLAIGVLSAAQCVARLQIEAAEQLNDESSGAAVWLSELIWREFYKHILVAYPNLIKHQPFQMDTAGIAWEHNQQQFEAWCNGCTGYPIVDAAMRQLNQTGWMHNRLRMITASFLVKDLHIDWRWGERYFMSRLIDGDFAANNGGWQWAASTGTDAVPYFRIFNPQTQSEKFDPTGDFIRSYVPELQHLKGKAIHWPHSLGGVKGYPYPIVDHAKSRQKTLALFEQVKKKS